jgi:site-specific recombinase XerD
MVWHSVRAGGDTKATKSRRTLQLPHRCIVALGLLRDRQDLVRRTTGDAWQNTDLVFMTRTGTRLSAGNVRREFRKVVDRSSLAGKDWTPRETRHSFVSLLSADGIPLEHISRLVGHSGTTVTETV